jgi:hypothetical protein
MPNQIGLAGGQPQKQTRFAPIYTGRWSRGLWTNRSSLRDGTTSRLQEKFYGTAGDALIDGLNVEITNRLTLARRPGNSIFDGSGYNAVANFQSFRLFDPTTEQIDVMVDEAAQLSSLYNGTKSTVWVKSPGAGQTYMQSVGNTLYFADGVSNKKWLQSLTVWASGAQWNTPTTPFLTTFLIDTNGNIQQLTGTGVDIASTAVSSGTITIILGATAQPGGGLHDIIVPGLSFTFPAGLTGSAGQLSGETVTITTVSGTALTVTGTTYTDYGTQAETGKTGTVIGGFPVSGSVLPTWSTTQPNSGNSFQGGITQDGTAQWTNRGITWASPNNGSAKSVQNWGIGLAPGTLVTPTINSSRVSWKAKTFYSNPGVIIDSNGNLQKVITDGTSGASAPTWATIVGNHTTDGSVTWNMIQDAASLTWAAGTAYTTGKFIVANGCLFRATASTQPTTTGTIDVYQWAVSHSAFVGAVSKYFPTLVASAGSHQTGNSFYVDKSQNPTTATWEQFSGAGAITSGTVLSIANNYNMAMIGNIHIPVAGDYTFVLTHHDGAFIGFGGSCTKVSGTFTDAMSTAHTGTYVNNYAIVAGTNGPGQSAGGIYTDSFVMNFPASGDYPVEINSDYWYHSTPTNVILTANGNNLFPGPIVSGAVAPTWPGWVTTYAPGYPTVSEASGHLTWENLGPSTDFTWAASTGFTLPNQQIIDPNGNLQAPYETGVTGPAGSEPAVWQTGINQLTNDNPNLIWINQGQASSSVLNGTMSAFSKLGWRYWIALVNTLDDTVSNAVPLTGPLGKIIGANSLDFAAGSGLPPAASIDPQADYVAIYRSTDGLAVPLLIPGTGESIYTVSLKDYLTNGYSDSTPDTSLDNLIQGAIAGENTPPAGGAKALTFHLSRIFFSVGNVVYWTSGPDTPDGNGVNGVAPLNFDELPSLVKRIVPTIIGALVFTVSDVYIIRGTGQTLRGDPIQSAQPYLKGIGLLSYNALDMAGSIIGLFTTDNQFIVLDPNSGVSYVGFPIGDRLRKNNGVAGTNWNPANVYVTWYANGEDQAWYVSDGTFGWYRLMTTPAPETGITWSPFAGIIGGAKAVLSVEVSPGVHKLLIGPTGASSNILNRDLTVNSDAGTSYAAWAAIGSAMLAQPGQVAEVSFITTESINLGLPLVMGVLMDEAWPYFTGPFELLKDWENDPPGLKKSKSILGQRFYLSEMHNEAAVCRHMQMQINWAVEAMPNELLSLTIFGAYSQEK